MRNTCFMVAKLLLIWLMSSLATITTAHEVTPTIANLYVKDGQAVLELRLNVEAFLAEIDLDGVADTDNTYQSGQYDALRALEPDALRPVVTDGMAVIMSGFTLNVDGTPLPMSFESMQLQPAGNVDLPRASDLTFTADMPANAQNFRLDWAQGNGEIVLRQQGVDDPYTGYINGGASSPDIAIAGGTPSVTALAAFAQYVPVGFDHILPKGLDHILFVLGLFFLSPRLKPLLWQVSAFTLAHTVTLAAGAMGWVNVPASIVEPLIAASICWIAVENIIGDGKLHRWRPVVIFSFGLLHGLGFASVLGEFGLPQGQFIPALIGFNVGVELGQLTVIALAFLAVGIWFRSKNWYRQAIAMPASGVIAMIGAYWVVERVFL